MLIISGLLLMAITTSCRKGFLEKPQGSDTTVDSVFSSAEKVQYAIAQAYTQSLAIGITIIPWDWNRDYCMRESTLDGISGENIATDFDWEDAWIIQRSGMTADDGSGIPRSEDGFSFNYKAIRQNYLVMENIGKVQDMTATEKAQVRAEMKTLTAYRYSEMFKRYGGVPIVEKTLNITDHLNIPRASLQQTLDFIIKLCDESVDSLPDSYPDKWKGRITKGVALAIKAETLMYAARPLFNAATPYMDFGGNNSLICFGQQDLSRWQQAVDAAKAALDWSLANGYHVINTGNPLDDFGTATSTPGNAEVLLAYKYQWANDVGALFFLYNLHTWVGNANGMSLTQLQQFYKADGADQDWTDETPRPYSEYYNKMQEMEARLKASIQAPGIDAWTNPSDAFWNSVNCFQSGDLGREECGRKAKFWYKAGTREWFEFPLYRVAELYLDLAEAYNELSQPSQSLSYLNVIRARAGLPAVTQTDKDALRKIIQREWAVEFYEENHRLHDVKHWKLPDIANGIIGGPKRSFTFTYTGSSAALPADFLTYANVIKYTAFWTASQYLCPFPASEVNKGYLVQNPGY